MKASKWFMVTAKNVGARKLEQVGFALTRGFSSVEGQYVEVFFTKPESQVLFLTMPPEEALRLAKMLTEAAKNHGETEEPVVDSGRETRLR